MMDDLFPTLKKSIDMLIEDEEGNVPAKKLLVLGSMILILGTLLPWDSFAAHRSHRSHYSHRSHGSGDGHSNHGNHASHSNHGSHGSHESHVSHTSHSNTASHSNSRYSVEGDVTYAPEASTFNGIAAPAISNTNELIQMPEMNLTDINQNIETPNGTPGSSIFSNLAIPASTVNATIESKGINVPASTENAQMDIAEINEPAATEVVE